ncbi:MBL fold metallo-hydrolase [uncultured Tateyamaria sp.]|uniref:MBL fold metallo-hydrolase n=1 Tax=uncultured Tateyamaria sp. TaxID=455651 RepID=UPI002638DAD8|nr:MBL fold metallo-hydrolase [uncultured Tateyamaria sp.]
MTDTTELFCLRPDVVVEPVVAGWYATTQLVSPLAHAMNTAFRHLPIMQSYIQSPQMHAAAVQDPDLLGGPFIDHPAERASDVVDLLESTRGAQQDHLKLADAVRTAWETLQNRAAGGSMADIYAAMPDDLRGFLELVYTPGGTPDLRVFEALLYRSAHYTPHLQGALIHRISGDERPFSMSTPRFPSPDKFALNRPFSDKAYDVLGRLRREPMSRADIASALQLNDAEAAAFDAFLTPASPRAPVEVATQSRWRYFGHACVLVESAGGRSVLVDPVIAYESGDAPERYTIDDLPDFIDVVLITHNHPDHVLIETLLALRWKIGTILVARSGGSMVDPSLKSALTAIGFADVREVDYLEAVQVGDVSIQALPFLGEHADLDISCKAAWLVDAGMRMVFAADSNNLDPVLYDRLATSIGRLDALFLGMECEGAPMSWLYGAMLPFAVDRADDQERRLDGSNATRARALIESLDVDQVYIYAMGLEPWLKFITGMAPEDDSTPMQQSEELLAQCRQVGMQAQRLYGRATSEDAVETVEFDL